MTLSSWILALPIVLVSPILTAQTEMTFVVPQGQVVLVRLRQQISSSNETVGEAVRMEALADVVVGGRVVVKKGAPLTANIAAAKKKAKRGPGGRVSIHITDVEMANGEKLALDTTQSDSGGGPNAKFYKGLVITSFVLLSPAGVTTSLLLHGQDVVLPEGSALEARVAKATTLDENRFELASVSAGTEISNTLAPKDDPIALQIATTAGDGSLWVDGEFRAECPTEVQVKPGLHMVKVVRDGYKTWQQKVVVNAGPSSLLVELQRKK